MWHVTSFTDNQHFSVAMPGAAPQFNPGAFGGTITVYSYAIDTYSPPGTVSLVASHGYLVAPGFLRWTSARHLVLSEMWSGIIRDIDLMASTARRVGMQDNQFILGNIPPGAWQTLACDRMGVLGPVDDIIMANFLIDASHYTWRLSLDGTVSQQGFSDFGQLPTTGQSCQLLQGSGHYPWAFEFSLEEGRAISSGTAQAPPAFLRIMEAADIPVNIQTDVNIKSAHWYNGSFIWQSGSVAAFPWGVRPAFSCLWGWQGNGHILGYSWDDLMVNGPLGHFASATPGDIGDQNLAAYIQSGMGGGTPRPEITGNDMRDLIYFIRRSTMAGSGLGGATLVVPGADNPDVTPPIITSLSAVRKSSTSITVSWTTDKPTIGLAMAGSPTQVGKPWPFNVPSPIEAGYGTSHSATITGIASGVTPVSYVAIAKDMAGYCVYSSASAVT
jgi:hypothetical protein